MSFGKYHDVKKMLQERGQYKQEINKALKIVYDIRICLKSGNGLGTLNKFKQKFFVEKR